MKVLITGGAGFIGSNLCRRMAQEPDVDEIVVLDDLSTGYEENLAEVGVTLSRSSLLDERAVAAAIDGCAAVVHLAALGSVPRSVADPVATHEANARGTVNVLQAARAAGNLHVVLASSSSVYGANPKIPKSEDLVCQPMSPYAVSKMATEQYAMAFARCYDLPVLPYRFFNVYGPRQRPGSAYAAVIPIFTAAALQGRPLPINGDGRQSRDFTFVDTVTEVLTRTVVGRVTSGPTNLAFGTRTDLLEVVAVLEQVLDRSLAIEYRPTRAGDVLHSQADNARLLQLFPDIEPHALADGVARTAAWMKTLPGISQGFAA